MLNHDLVISYDVSLMGVAPKPCRVRVLKWVYVYVCVIMDRSILLAVRYKACSRLIAGITGSNLAEDVDIHLLCLLCVV
jgi:hypothetical protein